MRMQNKIAKAFEEQKELFKMRNLLLDKVKALDNVYVHSDVF